MAPSQLPALAVLLPALAARLGALSPLLDEGSLAVVDQGACSDDGQHTLEDAIGLLQTGLAHQRTGAAPALVELLGTAALHGPHGPHFHSHGEQRAQGAQQPLHATLGSQAATSTATGGAARFTDASAAKEAGVPHGPQLRSREKPERLRAEGRPGPQHPEAEQKTPQLWGPAVGRESSASEARADDALRSDRRNGLASSQRRAASGMANASRPSPSSLPHIPHIRLNRDPEQFPWEDRRYPNAGPMFDSEGEGFVAQLLETDHLPHFFDHAQHALTRSRRTPQAGTDLRGQRLDTTQLGQRLHGPHLDGVHVEHGRHGPHLDIGHLEHGPHGPHIETGHPKHGPHLELGHREHEHQGRRVDGEEQPGLFAREQAGGVHHVKHVNTTQLNPVKKVTDTAVGMVKDKIDGALPHVPHAPHIHMRRTSLIEEHAAPEDTHLSELLETAAVPHGPHFHSHHWVQPAQQSPQVSKPEETEQPRDEGVVQEAALPPLAGSVAGPRHRAGPEVSIARASLGAGPPRPPAASRPS